MNLISRLRKLGLGEYEARTYTALVGMDKASAREIHESSGVPRTKVYDVLRSLAEKGFLEMQQGNPTYFRAVEPKEILERQLADIIDATEECIDELENLQIVKHKEVPLFWVVRGDWAIKTKIQELINEAESELSISCMETEILHQISGMLAGLNKKIRCLIRHRDDEIVNKLKNVEFKIMKTALLGRLAELFEGVEDEGIKFEMQCLIIIDNRRSIIILEENGKRSAVLISLPAIAYIQKTFYDTIWSNQRLPLQDQ